MHACENEFSMCVLQGNRNTPNPQSAIPTSLSEQQAAAAHAGWLADMQRKVSSSSVH